MAETASPRKVVGTVWVLAAIVGIGLAIVLQPIGDWAHGTAVDTIAIALWVAVGTTFLEGVIATRQPVSWSAR